jgi:hypothetical protein
MRQHAGALDIVGFTPVLSFLEHLGSNQLTPRREASLRAACGRDNVPSGSSRSGSKRVRPEVAQEWAGLWRDDQRRSVPNVMPESSDPPPRAQTLALQGLVNRLARGLLWTPLLCRVAGSRVITLYIVGRKSGRRYTVPVAYTRHDGFLLIGTSFA